MVHKQKTIQPIFVLHVDVHVGKFQIQINKLYDESNDSKTY